MRFLAFNILLLTILFSTTAVSQTIKKDGSPDGYNEVGRVLTLNNMGWMHPVMQRTAIRKLCNCRKPSTRAHHYISSFQNYMLLKNFAHDAYGLP